LSTKTKTFRRYLSFIVEIVKVWTVQLLLREYRICYNGSNSSNSYVRLICCTLIGYVLISEKSLQTRSRSPTLLIHRFLLFLLLLTRRCAINISCICRKCFWRDCKISKILRIIKRNVNTYQNEMKYSNRRIKVRVYTN